MAERCRALRVDAASDVSLSLTERSASLTLYNSFLLHYSGLGSLLILWVPKARRDLINPGTKTLVIPRGFRASFFVRQALLATQRGGSHIFLCQQFCWSGPITPNFNPQKRSSFAAEGDVS